MLILDCDSTAGHHTPGMQVRVGIPLGICSTKKKKESAEK
jgi:hypothetical protein